MNPGLSSRSLPGPREPRGERAAAGLCPQAGGGSGGPAPGPRAARPAAGSPDPAGCQPEAPPDRTRLPGDPAGPRGGEMAGGAACHSYHPSLSPTLRPQAQAPESSGAKESRGRQPVAWHAGPQPCCWHQELSARFVPGGPACASLSAVQGSCSRVPGASPAGGEDPQLGRLREKVPAPGGSSALGVSLEKGGSVGLGGVTALSGAPSEDTRGAGGPRPSR